MGRVPGCRITTFVVDEKDYDRLREENIRLKERLRILEEKK